MGARGPLGARESSSCCVGMLAYWRILREREGGGQLLGAWAITLLVAIMLGSFSFELSLLFMSFLLFCICILVLRFGGCLMWRLGGERQ